MKRKANGQAAAPTSKKKSKKHPEPEPESEDDEESSEDKAEEDEEKMVQLPVENADKAILKKDPYFKVWNFNFWKMLCVIFLSKFQNPVSITLRTNVISVYPSGILHSE